MPVFFVNEDQSSVWVKSLSEHYEAIETEQVKVGDPNLCKHLVLLKSPPHNKDDKYEFHSIAFTKMLN